MFCVRCAELLNPPSVSVGRKAPRISLKSLNRENSMPTNETRLQSAIYYDTHHIIHGGIEFEDSAGVFVHVLMSADDARSLAEHLLRVLSSQRNAFS